METTTLLIFFSFCMLLFYYYYYSRVIKSKDKGVSLPPGRWGWPVVGESLEFLANGRRGEPEKFMLKRMKKYSTTLFRTYLFGEPTVVMCGSAANKFLFTNENKLVQSWWPSSVDKLFPSSNLRSSTSKEEAIRMRKMLPSFFKPEALKQYVGIMDELTRRHFGSEWENKEVVHVYPLTKSLTFWMACSIFISVNDPRQVAEIGEPFDVLAAGVFSIPIDIPGTPFRKAIKASEWIRKELMRIIKQRKTDLEAGRSMQQHDILTHMLQTAREETGKNYELEDIADKILGLLIGGHDTASSACSFIVYYLANLPHIYQLVQQEQMEIAETKREGELLNWDDIQKMKYSWNVACEVLRLAPPVPGAFREALVDFNYNGFSIPKGWKLYWSAISTHRNTEYFEEPLKFDPTRFEEKGPAPYTFVPFGGGPRMCPGKEYARLEILVFMHHLVKRFRWEKLIPQEKVIFNPFPIPANGLPIRLFAHHSSDDD